MSGENHPANLGAPPCPECGVTMVLRTAKRGRNRGSQFWGCTTFPKCKGTRDLNSSAETTLTPNSSPDSLKDVPPNSKLLPVAWGESVRRLEFIPEYLSVGAMPGMMHDHLGEQPGLQRLLTQCVLLSRRSRTRQGASQHAQLVSALLRKILQRGRVPLPTLSVEREALGQHGLIEMTRNLEPDGVEMGWELQSNLAACISTEGIMASIADRHPFSLDPEFAAEADPHALLQSPAESWFLNQWVSDALGSSAAHWFTPQASLDTLLESAGIEGSGSRRIDFLFFHPSGGLIGIEIDGEEHTTAVLVDEVRDDSLKKAGIPVLRITHHEVKQGKGIVLDQLKSQCEKSLTAMKRSDADDKIASFLIDCSNAAKVQFAIARAIGWGWLTAGGQWNIELSGTGTEIVASGILDLLRLLSCIDLLYGGSSVPEQCTVSDDGGFSVAWGMNENGNWREITPSESQGDCLILAIESRSSPYHRLTYHRQPDLIVRPAFLPVEFAADQPNNPSRQAIVPTTYDKASPVLRTFLQTIFRKCEFRPMQGEAIYNTLRQKDSVVLLPTGAGKSLIYQLAGILMPGVTIVVDPLVSLIEDQVEGLHSYGIDRAAPIARNLMLPHELKHLLLRIERGDYHFVLLSPERLQSPKFRNTLRALAEISLVNLAVIDEAHCVSEWGHDFRPAYLHLGNNLRRFGADNDGNPPPLLALTGTASRAVLRDVLVDLGIDRNRSDALIRPESFDRAELSFEIVRTRPPEDPNAALRGILNALPAKLELPRTELYQPSGRHTASGIVFVPTVNARNYGLLDTRKTVQNATNTDVTIYSGGPPKPIDSTTWDSEKRTNASAFKRNQVPILVATKAFGMGIDKPNIRWTVHYGMPGSLESFYQEAGRAGRDRKPALCLVVFSEYDTVRSDALLDPNLNLPELRNRFTAEDKRTMSRDDVTRALWFHLEGFYGAREEIDDVKQRIDQLGDLSSRETVELPSGNNQERKRKEKALYRLLRIGVISDYQVDFGAAKFIITTEPFDYEKSKTLLLDYVYAAQPAKSRLIASQLDTIVPTTPRHAAFELARVLVEFVYDVIERSRRRMVQESVLLARSARSDEDIRTRLLDYLQEGLGAERISQLLDEPHISLLDWHNLVHKCQTPIDAGELRGLCIRALETYPDHPGLLLARAASEAMSSDYDLAVSSQGISAAIRGSVVDYRITRREVESSIEAMFDLSRTRSRELGIALIVALLGLDDSNAELTFAVDMGLAKAEVFEDERIRAAVATHRIQRLADALETAISRLNHQYKTKSVFDALSQRSIA